MRITRRTSGGRGEYEISEETESGLSPHDLLDRVLVLRLVNGWQIDTGTQLKSQGGKFRLRRTARTGASMQVARQLAAVLMMPEPVRANPAFGVGEPVLQPARYAIDHITINEVELIDSSRAILNVDKIILRNGSVEAEELPIESRLASLAAVWAAKNEFPSDIANLIDEHQASVLRGTAITSAVEQAVEQLQILTSERSGDMAIVYSQQTDVLVALQQALEMDVPIPVVEPDQVDPAEPDVKLRTVKEWKRWANARGPKSARFRFAVREAYKATCLICGNRFPPTSFSAPGVDAAHILPWSKYDLDEVHNGLCLCKLHHWAFDESLLTISHENGRYAVDLPSDVEDRLAIEDEEFSVETLRQEVGWIASERLPQDRGHWPRPQFLELLNSALP